MTTITRKIHFATKGNYKRIRYGSRPESSRPKGRTPRVSKLMALAIRFDDLLRAGTISNLTDLAHLARVTQPRMTQIMNLLHLAPDIQEEILHLPTAYKGRDPITEHDLRPITRLIDWSVQRAAWDQFRSRL